MAKNRALNQAARDQQDEFYTQLLDIAEELQHYRPHFRGKKILCNCDDPYESNFFRYFAQRFNIFGLKKLTATCYAGSPIAQQQLTLFEEEYEAPSRTPYCAEITGLRTDKTGSPEDLQDIRYILEHQEGATIRKLQGDGDFRSQECIELLKDADIVATNPPFSLLREYIALLMKYHKKFIIIGNVNAITYKEIFPLFMQNKIWLGYGFSKGNAYFSVPSAQEDSAERYAAGVYDKENKVVKFRNCTWFTNLDSDKRHKKLALTQSYEQTPERYPKYDNYDAIEVSKTSDIPCDYSGIMGVPITFMDKYNPDQFEILGITEKNSPLSICNGKTDRPYIDGKRMYARLLIRRKSQG